MIIDRFNVTFSVNFLNFAWAWKGSYAWLPHRELAHLQFSLMSLVSDYSLFSYFTKLKNIPSGFFSQLILCKLNESGKTGGVKTDFSLRVSDAPNWTNRTEGQITQWYFFVWRYKTLQIGLGTLWVLSPSEIELISAINFIFTEFRRMINHLFAKMRKLRSDLTDFVKGVDYYSFAFNVLLIDYIFVAHCFGTWVTTPLA